MKDTKARSAKCLITVHLGSRDVLQIVYAFVSFCFWGRAVLKAFSLNLPPSVHTIQLVKQRHTPHCIEDYSRCLNMYCHNSVHHRCIIQHMHSVIHHLWHTSTATCCGTSVPKHVAVVSQCACVGWYIDSKNLHAMSNIKNQYVISKYILYIKYFYFYVCYNAFYI